MNSKVVVIRADEGKVTESQVVEGKLEDIVKQITKKAVEEWDPGTSDLTVLHTKLELRYKKPLPPEVADAIFNLNLEYSLEGNDVIVNLPVIVVSFDNRWLDETRYEERRIYVIAPYIDESTIEQLREYAAETTKAPKDVASLTAGEGQLELSEEEIRRLEEGLEEVEAERETTAKRKSRRRKKK